MTSQQVAGLHPYITELSFLNNNKYPEISLSRPTSLEKTSPVVTNNSNIYDVTITETNGARTLNLMKYQIQDYHENHFVGKPARDKIPVCFDICASPVVCNPRLYLEDDSLYLIFGTTKGNVYRYERNDSYGSDINKLWDTSFNTVNNQVSDLLFNKESISDYIYPYRIETDGITLDRISISDGTFTTYKKITNIIGPSDIVLGLHTNSLYISFRKTGSLYITYADMSIPGDSVSTIIQRVTSGAEPPLILPYVDAVSLFYGFNNDRSNILQFANIITNIITVPIPSTDLTVPIYYNINKGLPPDGLYGEPAVANQTTFTCSYAVNPLNNNFIYIAYITTTNEIRVMKFYRTLIDNTIEKYKYLLMWSSRVGGFKGYEYTGGGLNIMAEDNGLIYVMARSDNIIRMWKINEFPLNLGHTHDNVLSASANTIPDMLSSLSNSYDIASLTNFHGDLPKFSEPIISSVVDRSGLKDITFRYLNYDLFILYPDLGNNLKTSVIDAFKVLYSNSSYQVPSAQEVLSGHNDKVVMTFSIPSGLTVPCVLQGTEILYYNIYNQSVDIIEIEKICVNDIVINQNGKHVKVLKHTISEIITSKTDSPSIIPVDYFGEDRPYKPLGISKDHGIFVNNGFVFTPDLKGIRTMQYGIPVTYHHLLLENDVNNCFVANGLYVDSLHNGPYVVCKAHRK